MTLRASGFTRFNPRPHTRSDKVGYYRALPCCVSIHAPTRGATFSLVFYYTDDTSFNPRPHARGDALTAAIINAAKHVSIHAPARGATHLLLQLLTLQSMFQSTPPRGGRQRKKIKQSGSTSFNPRPRAGGDMYSYSLYRLVQRFQSTPPRGGRQQTPKELHEH